MSKVHKTLSCSTRIRLQILRPIRCTHGLIWAELRGSSGINFMLLKVSWRTESTTSPKSFLLMLRESKQMSFHSCQSQLKFSSPNTTNRWSLIQSKESNLWCSAKFPPKLMNQLTMTRSQPRDKWSLCIAVKRDLVILESLAPSKWTHEVHSCSISVSWRFFHAAALEDVWLFLFPRLVTTSLTHANTWVNRIKMLSSSKKLFNECTTKFIRNR